MVSVIGHRGAAGYEPENTFRSFELAIKMGVQYVETDIRVTKDNHLVLIHDRNVSRTTNGFGNVDEMTLEQLKRLDAGKGERIPTLQEALDEFSSLVGFVLEVKVPGTENSIAKMVINKRTEASTYIVSFYHRSILRIKRNYPKIKCGIIYSCDPINHIALASASMADTLVPNYNYVTKRLVSDVHKTHLEIHTWTVNSEEIAKNLILLGVDGITSDYPDVVINAARHVKDK
ncbi:MAG: glycerophosphodiester phosphodiesterase family protein [Conexivisphaerales archaeon]